MFQIEVLERVALGQGQQIWKSNIERYEILSLFVIIGISGRATQNETTWKLVSLRSWWS